MHLDGGRGPISVVREARRHADRDRGGPGREEGEFCVLARGRFIPLSFAFRCCDAMEAAGDGGFDHLSLVSVLNDPEHYPTVSDMSYGRLHPVQMDLVAFEQERSRLRSLVDHLLGVLTTPAWLTTTIEEMPWVLAVAETRGLRLEADEDIVETALVGDPLCFLRISQG